MYEVELHNQSHQPRKFYCRCLDCIQHFHLDSKYITHFIIPARGHMLTCLPVVVTLFTHIPDSSTQTFNFMGKVNMLSSCAPFLLLCIHVILLYTTFMFLCRHISNTCTYIFPQSNACTYILPSINASSCLNRFLVLSTFHNAILSRHPEYPQLRTVLIVI